MSRKTKLITILLAVGVPAALGSAIMPPGIGQLLVGMVGLAFVLAALAVLNTGWSPTGKARSPRASAKAPPPEPEDEQPPPPEAGSPKVDRRP